MHPDIEIMVRKGAGYAYKTDDPKDYICPCTGGIFIFGREAYTDRMELLYCGQGISEVTGICEK